jgi:hypothetical protein
MCRRLTVKQMIWYVLTYSHLRDVTHRRLVVIYRHFGTCTDIAVNKCSLTLRFVVFRNFVRLGVLSLIKEVDMNVP